MSATTEAMSIETEPPRPVRRVLRAAWPWLLLAAALGLWTVGGGGGGSELPTGEPAPALSIPWTAGEEPFDLSAQQGRVVVLAFWATWCPACRAEGPALARVSRRIEDQGDRVVGVSVDDAPLEAVHRVATGLGMTYPIALATRADARRFSVELLPTIYVIAPDGRIVEAFTGSVGEQAILDAVERARDTRVSAR